MESSTLEHRSQQRNDVGEALLRRASLLNRLVLARSQAQISRTEAGVLGALALRPHRITELAAGEGVSQPAISRLIDRLEQRAWVTREPDPRDGRVVLARLLPAGQVALDALRAEYRELVTDQMAAMSDRDVEALTRAIDVLDTVITSLGVPA